MSRFSILQKLIPLVLLVFPVLTMGADASRGPALFAQNCRPCHSPDRGTKPDMYGMNLTLYGIIGRKSASVEGFFYSEAMKASGITWSADLIKIFITDPTIVVPETRMMFFGIPNEKDREDLVEFLKTLND